MDETIKDTGQKIMDAARTVFLRKGMDGARMQEIADEAGINKALLHYYFRNKEKLFQAILHETFRKAFPDVMGIMDSEMEFEKKIEAFIDKYFDILQQNPYLPSFMLREINRDPSSAAAVIKNSGFEPVRIFKVLELAMDSGRIRRMDPRELMVNIISMVVFPFAIAPLAREIFFAGNLEEFNDFIRKRKKNIADFVINSIALP